jgi:hypothetical protein
VSHFAGSDRGRPSLREVLGNAVVRFWVCPVPEHGDRKNESGWPVVTVEWIDGVAHCTMPDCGLTSENVRIALCTNYLEIEDKPCDGILRFLPDDVQAACPSCGAWCGYMVANYVRPFTVNPPGAQS